jgi:hypothetical protein
MLYIYLLNYLLDVLLIIYGSWDLVNFLLNFLFKDLTFSFKINEKSSFFALERRRKIVCLKGVRVIYTCGVGLTGTTNDFFQGTRILNNGGKTVY